MKQPNRTPRFSRRSLLLGSAAVTAGAMASRFGFSPEAFAQMAARNDRQRFIICYIGGGWDQLLFTDPRDPARYNDASRNQTLTDTRYEQLDDYNGFSSRLVTRPGSNLVFGPAAEKPGSDRPKIADHFQKISLVRGINMGTLGHVQGMRYFLTGQFPSGNVARGTNTTTELAAQMNSRLPLPVLSLSMEAYNDRHAGRYSAFGAQALGDMMQVLTREGSLRERDEAEAALEEFEQRAAPCAVNVYDRRGVFSAVRSGGRTAGEIVNSDIALRLQFLTDPAPVDASNPRHATTEAVRARNPGLRSRFGVDPSEPYSCGAVAALASLAIREQVSQCVSIGLPAGADSHAQNNRVHASALYPGIDAIAALIEDLSVNDAPADLGGKWIDHTTVLAFSEFSRTPMFNADDGRDHHLSSSCLIAGGNIIGNKVVGASGAVGMGVGLYDFAGGADRRGGIATGETGENIRPEDVVATLLASAGLDYSFLRSVGRYSNPLWEIIRTA